MVEQARLRALQMRCKHPGMTSYVSMGERESSCPDCGLSG